MGRQQFHYSPEGVANTQRTMHNPAEVHATLTQHSADYRRLPASLCSDLLVVYVLPSVNSSLLAQSLGSH